MKKTIFAMGTLLACFFSVARTEETSSPVPERYFTNTELVDQDGKTVRFYSDVLKGKTVVINVFFTTCSNTCPTMNKSLEYIQKGLGERVGKDVFLVSITVDPETDTPEKLKAYAKKFNAKPGWIFLTGEKENVLTILKKLGQDVEDKNKHRNLFLVGNDRTGLWKKVLGLGKPEEVLESVESVVNDKG